MTQHAPCTLVVTFEHAASADEARAMVAAIRLLRGVADVHVQPRYVPNPSGTAPPRYAPPAPVIDLDSV